MRAWSGRAGDAMSAATPVQAARDEAARHRWRQSGPWVRAAAAVGFAVLPLAVGSFQVLDLAAKILIFAALVASYDVLIGYTGIVSFGHAMYFGFGAYAVALAVTRLGAPTYGHL